MKIKKALLSVLACALSLVFVFAFTACGNETGDPEATGITLDLNTASVATGDTQRLTATVTYSDDSTKPNPAEVEWSSSNETVATVARGVVSAKTKGDATITAKIGEYSATCAISVYLLEIEISGEGITDGSVELEKGATLELNATVKKDGVAQTDAEIEWKSANETAVTVADGVVSAINPGSSEITAKIKNGSQSASVTVTVSEPEGYNLSKNYEQNKAPADTWGYWNDLSYNWANSTVYSAYYEEYEKYHTADEGYEYIGANKMTIDFSVDSYGGWAAGPNNAVIQLFYRSSQGNNGKLLPNHNYEVKLIIESSAAGTISFNDFTKLPDNVLDGVEIGEITEDEEYLIDIEAGVNEVSVKFRHGDSGAIYANGVYDNIESAIQLCLGLLSEPGENNRVQVSVYDIQYKDLGEATSKWEDNPACLEGYVAPPAELPEIDAEDIALDIINDNDHKDQAQTNGDEGTYTVTASADKKSYDIEYTTKTSTYEFFKVDLSGVGTENYNTFAVTLTNNGTSEVAIRFDLNGATKTVDPTGAMTIVDCVTGKGISTGGSISWDSSWGGTVFTVGAGQTQTIYLTYACDVHGEPVELAIYCNTQWYGNESSGWQEIREERTGNITLSGFKFANVD